MNIDLSEYEQIKPDSIVIKDTIDEEFYDIEVEDDNTFHLVTKDEKLILTHNCDGIHIRGLILAFIEKMWPNLLEMGFVFEFITPILKISKGKKSIPFYTHNEFKKWESKGLKGWDVKYYKGLGTSTPKEMKEYFKDLDSHLLPMEWDTDKNHDYIDMVFNNKRSDERKDWMMNTDIQEVVKFKTPTPISSFINNEMITFSLADNIRSIPDIYDGLKPSQRKILNTCLNRNIVKDTPVSSLGGSTKESQKYHHGEQSLEQGIVNMAQDFVGANNINLLVPEGQFGTRLQGGKDAASSRYINTFLSPITRLIFDKRDDDILEEQYEDNYKIEPKQFKPIIPMVLVNGTEGIGTGWSTNIPKYNPKDVIRLIENKLNGKKSNRIHPWYKGFKGDIEETDNGYITYGKFEAVNSTTIHVTELPIGYWTQKFTENLHKMIESKFIKDFEDNSTETDVNITIKVPRENMVKLSTKDSIITQFKLSSRLYTSNMHLFYKDNIKKYESPEDIIDDYYKMRLDDYSKRKKHLLDKLGKEKTKLDNQVKFIKMVISNKMKINNRKKTAIVKDLKKNKFDLYDDSYDYLLNMAIYNLSKDKVDELTNKAKDRDKDYKTLKKMTPKKLWLEDLSVVKKLV